MDDPKKDATGQKDDSSPNEAPVDGPGGDEGPGGLGSTSQDSPGEVDGGGTSGV